MAYHQPHAQWDPASNTSPVQASHDDFPPPPPAHRLPVQNMHSQRQYTDPNNYSDYSTPGSDHAGDDGRNGLASPERRAMGMPERSQNSTPFSDQNAYEQPMLPRAMYSQQSSAPGAPLATGAAGMYSSSSSMHSMPVSPPHRVPYSDTPYNRYSSSAQNLAPQMGMINPNEVADDDDWGMGPTPLHSVSNKRRSFVPFGGSRGASRGTSRDGSSASPGSSINSGVVGAGAAGAAAGTAAYAAAKDGNGQYDAVPMVNGSQELMAEKSSWKVEDDKRKRKKRMWIAIAIITVILLAAILGGVLGAMLKDNGGGQSDRKSSGASAGDIAKDNKDDLGKNSDEIKALMNNANLHKVFPGMDYTPLNVQYPECLKAGPSQNNITRDMAVMSQLTNAVRLYGTDCNQTQMLIHAIDRLEIKDTMKIWLGVWLDSNDTTTERQIAQTWTILDDYGCDYFKGIIIGNEVLYRKDLTATELLGHISDFRQNITDHKCKLPVAMADLGDNWTADMATKVDYVMSNVHPFFAGVDAKDAAAWTWNFWQEKDVTLTANDKNIKQVIAEVGWPSSGGTSCGAADTCTEGSVAGIDEMNQFMEDWVCPSMKNETEYFWFSAFDEPWKIKYNTKGKNWEDKWGLMDIDRNLKPGVKIPSCDGQTLPTF
ncbi:glycoside hydrolase family 17 protein [Plenodomus tracheiphilus IPT5]|uniref:glucan endo-1,3-beta-D-glucosidase n=1 Tax=Plenodomus tracheiphilus IPT5 TaxID=1408161 RepID=A0A6A7AYX2_9PLEO|nr:glycoside hydrolase family 17 protein [Plenodomus tracheiphilus IPT5]